MANSSITAAQGFEAAGISCGIKQSGHLDLGLISCPTGAMAAAVFTTNRITSPAMDVCRDHAGGSGRVKAVIANSGNANACTGRSGRKDALAMCRETALHLDGQTEEVLPASTGIIGKPLPMSKVRQGIGVAARTLSPSAKAGLQFARAIMTTDTRPKQAVRRFTVSGRDITVAGTIKGAGMIGPNMATTLCFLTTDLAMHQSLLGRALRTAVGASLNKLTVDGHQSTNDTAILLASGLAGNRASTAQQPAYRCFVAALVSLCDDLTRQMALDAEGATRMFKVVVTGAASQREAARGARAVAGYDLVKCAVHGADPNWGRILCAIGSAGVQLRLDRLTCKLDKLTVFRRGGPCKFDIKEARRIISRKEHTIFIELGVGSHRDFCYGVDLSEEYVAINADYHT